MTGGANAHDVPQDVVTAVAAVAGPLPLAAVLLDEDGRVVWSNEVVQLLTRDRGAGIQRLLETVAAAAAAATGPVVRASLPSDRGLLERELWIAALDGGARLVTFHPERSPSPDHDRERTARLESMLEHTHDLVTILDGDGRIVVSNAAAGILSGFSGSSVNGIEALSFVHPDDVDRVAAAFLDILAAPGLHPQLELRLRFADGTWHDLEVTPNNLLHVPAVQGIVVAMHDVTDRKRAETDARKSHAYLQSLIENLTDVIVVLDENFEVIWTSPALSSIIEAPAETNLGMSAFNDMHPDDLEPVMRSLTELAASPPGTHFRIGLRLESLPGSDRWRWVEATAVNRLADPNVGGIVCTLHDVTEAKASEAELQAAVERERRTTERLRELDVLKDQFLASVSHEMRTPLAIIIGFADVLAKGDAVAEDVRREAVARIRSSATEMRGMVENLLDHSELEAGKLPMRLRPVALRGAVEATLANIEALLSKHPVVVEVPDSMAVTADTDGLDRVLRNLVVNAAKFSPGGHPIVIRAMADGDQVVIEVVDEGVGIADDQVALVFDRLYRAPGASFVARGTGVGLNMVRRYVELMGGTVSLRSVVGEGSTFTVRLPAA